MMEKEELLILALQTLAVAIALSLLIRFLSSALRRRSGLPPGPPAFPIIGNLLWLRHGISDIESVVRRLRSQYGPVITLHMGSRPSIYVSDRTLAHKLLVQNGAVFADRPAQSEALRLLTSDGYQINVASYGPLWRLLRRNLTTEILQPSRARLFSPARDWILGILLAEIKSQAAEHDGIVTLVDALQYAMFNLLIFMCFGEKLDASGVRQIEQVQREVLLFFRKMMVFSMFPQFARFIFRQRWRKLSEMKQRQMEVFVPLINLRRKRRDAKDGGALAYSYVDSLLDLRLPGEEGDRELTDGEIVSLCSEFLNAGTDTTSTALQWIMANVVKHRQVQERLAGEIGGTIGEKVREEELQGMAYLKAVVLEGLRRHPPGHFVLPHVATEAAAVDAHLYPRDAAINFTVADMGWDPKVWSDPMGFRPERFLEGGEGEGVDLTGSREIKMMPFGVGRRICPGLHLALLHLEFFVANLVKHFRWEAVDDDVDLSEKTEFTVVMRTPLRARVSPRVDLPPAGDA